MPCNNCQKIISQLKEDPREEKEIIKGLINCKECSEKIIARCHTCHWPIYSHYLTYEDSGSWSFGIWPMTFTHDWKSTRCDWCHKQWLTEKKKAKEWWKRKRWVVWICQATFLILSLFLFYKEFYLIGVVILIPTVFSFPFFLAIWPAWIDLKRYKSRERKEKKKLKTPLPPKN